MKKQFTLLFLMFGLLASAQKMNFQGKLFQSGAPVNTSTGSFQFEIESINWIEQHTNVEVVNGLYHIVLGSNNPLPESLFESSNTQILKVFYGPLAGPQLIDEVQLFAPFERDYTIADNIKDGISWNEVSNKPDLDTDITNEIQTLSINGNVLSIMQGNTVTNSVTLPGGGSGGDLLVNGSVTVIDSTCSPMLTIPCAGFATCTGSNNAPIWQSFTAAANGRLCQLTMNLAVSQGSGVRVRFFSGSGNSTVSIAQKDFPNLVNPLTLTQRILDLTTEIFPVSISSGSVYTFEISALTPNSTVTANCSNSNPYTLGGNDLSITQSDYCFALSIDNVAPPILATGNSGFVGIGTSTPTAALEVNGRVKDKFGFLVPAGVILPFAGENIPEGWYLCNGQPISRVNDSELFDAIGTAWGAGNGTTTFNLPDMRGVFMRGVDNNRGLDPDTSSRTAALDVQGLPGNTGNNVGSYQTDEFKSHTHTPTQQVPMGVGLTNFQSGPNGTGVFGAQAFTLNQSGGSETRPVNVNVNYIIKR